LVSAKLAAKHARELVAQCGANEFFEKPDVMTWAPRLKAMLRLPPYRSVSGVGRIQLDGNRIRIRDYAATLRGKERTLVEFLLEDPDRERSLEEIALRVWGRHSEPQTTLVESTISRIREKLGEERDLIERGPVGWRIRVSPIEAVKNFK